MIVNSLFDYCIYYSWFLSEESILKFDTSFCSSLLEFKLIELLYKPSIFYSYSFSLNFKSFISFNALSMSGFAEFYDISLTLIVVLTCLAFCPKWRVLTVSW